MPCYLAALPGGERMAISTTETKRVHIVDKEMKLQRTLGDAASGVTFGYVHDFAAGDGLYVSQYAPDRVRRLAVDTFAVAAEYTSGEHHRFYDLALAPGGVLFVKARRNDDYKQELLALDAVSLSVRFTIAPDVLGVARLSGLAVCGDELFVGNTRDSSIRVLSLSGEPRRVLSAETGGWRSPRTLCCVGDRLYLTEARDYGLDEASRMTARRVFVLTPEGETLQVYNSPRPLKREVHWRGICHFDGKLWLADSDQEELVALQGL